MLVMSKPCVCLMLMFFSNDAMSFSHQELFEQLPANERQGLLSSLQAIYGTRDGATPIAMENPEMDENWGHG